ncbi:DUF362 domain-containing protein [Methanofollis fontis]|nr:DUF362 domain-containing protein [Methanofollis fontis]
MRTIVIPDLTGTHSRVVRAVVEAVEGAGGAPVIGYSPDGGAGTLRRLLAKTGIQDVIDECGCESVCLDDDTEMIPAPGALTFRRLMVAREVLDADAVICLPTLKSTCLNGYSGAVSFLCHYMPRAARIAYRRHVCSDPALYADLLLDVHATVPPSLSIMEGIAGIRGPDGPGFIMASTSSTVLDYTAAAAVGLDPLSVPTIGRAYGRGEGPGSLSEIRVFGTPPPGFSPGDGVVHPAGREKGPSLAVRLADRTLAARPLIDAERCTGCGVCADLCPTGAIRMKASALPRIRVAECIRCLRCQERCPADAVVVGLPLLARLFR